MKKNMMALALAAGIVCAGAPASGKSSEPEQAPLTAEQKAEVARLETMLREQHPRSGDVALPAANATLHLGKDYYFLNAAETRRVLVDAWGNPPSVAEGVLGMVFPAGKTFLDDTWGAVLTYEASGYVSDDDAQSTDYGALMTELQSGEDEINSRRKAEGYPPQHLVGWAQSPSYDAKSHSVIWAQNIKFGDETDHSLNYDVRLLGRHGVLSMNLLSAMSKLPEIRLAASAFAKSAAFDTGSRYADFNKDTDKVAEYGVGGLVAAGLGVAAAKKFGLLALILAFGKKAFVFIALAVGLLWRKIAGLFRRGEEETI